MNIISVSYGNDSIALIQWAHEHELEDCYVVYADTGWSHPDWNDRVVAGEKLAEQYGFITWRVKGVFNFQSLVKWKKCFPSSKIQFCSGFLKAIPLGDFADFIDPNTEAVVVIGKRREESEKRKNIDEFDYDSPYHGGRVVWHPLYAHTAAERNELIIRAGLEVLPHRSLECCPCVNANRSDLLNTPETQLQKCRELETAVGNYMFRANKHMGAKGIDEILKWAMSDRGKYRKGQGMLWDYTGAFCESGLCG